VDALSRLLALYPVRTALDIRCHLGAPWQMEEAAVAAGIAPYHMIVEGNAWLVLADHPPRALQAGDIVVLPHGSAHVLRAGPAETAAQGRQIVELETNALVQVKGNHGGGAHTDILCGQFHFDTDAALALLAGLPQALVVSTAGRADFLGLNSLMSMLRFETEAQRPGAKAVVAQLSSALFALLIRAWLEQAERTTGLFALLAEPRLQAALQHMLAQPGTAWSMEQLAQACHMSRATFARLFTRAAGATPGEVLTRTRMAQAAHWLTNGTQSVAAIGEAVGYQSEAAFNRVFKRSFGVGPGQFRRRARANDTDPLPAVATAAI